MTQLSVDEKEISSKGKCYVVCTAYDAADFDTVLAAVIDMERERGARSMYFSCRDTALQLRGECCTLGGQVFCCDTAFAILEKPLTEARTAATPALRMKPLRESNASIYCALSNESFFTVSNSRTMDAAETDAILADGQRSAGFFMLGGEPLGIFEIDCREPLPEIAAIAIRPEYRKQGYGARGLHTLETRLATEGCSAVQVLVAESNREAYSLYLANGYRQKREHSRWFRVELWREQAENTTDSGLSGGQKVF